jgi:hypothetical protein
MKQAKFQRLQDQSQIKQCVTFEARRHFRKKMREYLRDKINQLATHCKNKIIRDLHRKINQFK